MTAISPEARMLIRSQIEELVTEYGFLFDHGQADKMADLFTEDASFKGLAGTANGRAELNAIFTKTAKAMTASRHCSTNLRLTVEAPDRASGYVLVTSYGHMGAGMGKPHAHTVGDFEDTYVKGADGKWRFSSRKVVSAFSAWGK